MDVEIEVRLDSFNGTLLHSETIDIQANSIQDLEDFTWVSEGQGDHKFLVMCIVDSSENEEVRYDNNNASKSLCLNNESSSIVIFASKAINLLSDTRANGLISIREQS